MAVVDLLGGVFVRFFFPRKEPLKKPKKILVAQIAHLGDVLLSLEVLPHLRKAFPEAEVHFLVGSWARDIVSRAPGVEKVITYDNAFLSRSNENILKRVCMDLRSFSQAVQAIRQEGYDLALELRAYFPNSIPLLALGGVRYRVGYPTGGFGFLLDKRVGWRCEVHETEHYLDLVRAVARVPHPCEVAHEEFGFLAEEAAAEKLLQEHGLRAGDRFVVLHPGAGARQKCWAPLNWRTLTSRFLERGIPVVLTGSWADASFVGKIAAFGELAGVVSLVGKTDIPTLAGIFRYASLVVGVDSFACHLAALLGRPTVAIYGGISATEQWRPIGSGRVRVVRNHVDCAPCYASKGCAEMRCLKIDPEIVFAHCLELLEGEQD